VKWPNRWFFWKFWRVSDFGRLAQRGPIALKPSSWLKKPQNEAFGMRLYIISGELSARKLAVVTGYCVYEKKKNREIKNPKQIKLKNGRPAIKGTCGSCGKPIFRIGKLK